MSFICQHFNICGGCDYQDKLYEEQLSFKQEYIEHLFKEFEIEKIDKIIPSPQIWYYRNKMEFAVGGTIESPLIGLREKNRFYKIVNLQECKIFYDRLNEILNIIRQWIKEMKVQPYDIVLHKGKLRYIVFRHSKKYNNLMLAITITGTKYQFEYSEKEIFYNLMERLKPVENISSFYVCINNKVSDNALDQEIFLLYGEQFIKEKINDIEYKIYPTVFTQTNTFCCEVLYNLITKEVTDGNILDLYCGSGGITLQVAKYVEKIIGVDNSKDNISIANENLQMNKITNVEFVCENVETFLSKLWKSKFLTNVSTIIVDPPRAGLSKKVRSCIIETGVNKIIYVSCNPESLKDSLKSFLKFYKIKRLIPIDMFPHTKHLECITVLEHR